MLMDAIVRGEGGLHAMRDALNLSRVVSTAAKGDLVAALNGYQDEMLSRGADAVRKSRDAFATDGATPQSVWGKRPQMLESKFAKSGAHSGQNGN